MAKRNYKQHKFRIVLFFDEYFGCIRTVICLQQSLARFMRGAFADGKEEKYNQTRSKGVCETTTKTD